jgi:hypothetical protein
MEIEAAYYQLNSDDLSQLYIHTYIYIYTHTYIRQHIESQ